MSTAHEIMSEPGFVSGIGWVDGAADAVRLFRRWGHDVLCVTSPYSGSRTWMRERLEWLEPLFHHDDVLFVKGARKPLVRGDVLVEDHPAIACAWLEANPEGKAILVDRPWNSPDAAEWQPHDRMIRVLDAADIPTIVHLARRL
jgi:5'(3')-deoxyribonucleotidase